MKAFSELTSASHVNNADILAISQENNGTYSSKKTTVKEVSDFANQNLAEEYDSTSSYAVGDYCIYESVLYKCTASTTGSFDNTKWTTVYVTDEMGSGGGGTGGHTIVDENGTSMTARAGLQFVGGANVSDDPTNNKTIVDVASASGIDGVFIDTSNVIKSTTAFTSSMSYEATDDCCVAFYIVGKQNADGLIKIDNKKVGGFFASSIEGFSCAYYLKKGQTITVANAHASYSSDYTVYGILTRTTHSKFQPVIYSTEEREVGVWKDGKPLYQKTLVVPSVGSVGSSLVTPITINDIPFDFVTVIDANIYDVNDKRWYPLSSLMKSAGARIFISPYLNKDANPVVFYASLFTGGDTFSNLGDFNVTIQYTKSTDTAGSGTWTPQGVPAVHYSTDEQVIGTWIDGKTTYGKVFELQNSLLINADSWGDTPISNADKAVIVDVKLWDTNGTIFTQIGANRDNQSGYVQILNSRNSAISINKIYLEYTKTS